jgi:hypothetical protein
VKSARYKPLRSTLAFLGCGVIETPLQYRFDKLHGGFELPFIQVNERSEYRR